MIHDYEQQLKDII